MSGGDELTQNLQSGYRKLRSAVANAGLRPESSTWLIKALDPYHDNPGVPCTGMPDKFEGRSIVREVNQTYTVNAQTFTLAPTDTETWNLNIGILPLMSYQDVTNCALRAQRGLLTTTSASDEAVGYLGQIGIAGNINNPTDIETYPWPSNQLDSWGVVSVAGKRGYYTASPWEDAYPYPDNQNPSAVRCIGVAFEVMDLTNPFYQQGMCTVYKMNTEYDQSPKELLGHFQPISSNEDWTNHQFYVFQTPANYPQEVNNLPGTAQWNAQKGCYCVGIMDPENLTDFSHYLDQRGFCGINSLTQAPATEGQNQVVAGVANLNFWKAPGVWDDTPSVYINKPFLPTGTQTSGAIFTGLSKQASLQIRIRAVFETIPDQSQADILLAPSPSAPYDQAALDLYAEVVKNMPPGVTYDENPLGEWFDKVMSIVAAFAAPVGAAITGGFMGDPSSGMAIGGGVATAANFLSKFNAGFRK